MWAALALCAGILLTAAYVPSLAYMLHMVAPEIKMWGIIFLMSTLPCSLGRSSGALFAGMNQNVINSFRLEITEPAEFQLNNLQHITLPRHRYHRYG